MIFPQTGDDVLMIYILGGLIVLCVFGAAAAAFLLWKATSRKARPADKNGARPKSADGVQHDH